MRNRILAVLVGAAAVLSLAVPCSGAQTSSTTPTVDRPIALGFNQGWGGQAGLPLLLDDSMLDQLVALGTDTIRLPVGCWHVGACTYETRYDDTRNFAAVTSWDWTQLDEAIDHLRSHGIDAVVAPHPGDRMFRPGWIVVDRHYNSTMAYVDAMVRHLHARYGPMAYSFFETELNTSEQVRADGSVGYRYASDNDGLATKWQQWLRTAYPSLDALRKAHGAKYKSWSSVPLPNLGSSTGVPSSVYGARSSTDVRAFLGDLSAERYNAIGARIHQLSPGSEWWGPTVNVESMHTERGIHEPANLTPVGPTLSDLARQPEIDVLSVDGYRSYSIEEAWRAAADWKIAARVAANHGKQVAITEVGGPNDSRFVNAMLGVNSGAENLRAVLIWEARARPHSGSYGFGYFDENGVARTARGPWVTWMFDQVRPEGRRTYTPGTARFDYREGALLEVTRAGTETVGAIDLAASAMAAGHDVEPVVRP